ncbi:hypothetical protein F5Y12DRAFT_718614 [Xylaria sp. FL1777]|nr:hypothetical protein F5Y12DRAFT_718614 [Xylaria sp. FL1777]
MNTEKDPAGPLRHTCFEFERFLMDLNLDTVHLVRLEGGERDYLQQLEELNNQHIEHLKARTARGTHNKFTENKVAGKGVPELHERLWSLENSIEKSIEHLSRYLGPDNVLASTGEPQKPQEPGDNPAANQQPTDESLGAQISPGLLGQQRRFREGLNTLDEFAKQIRQNMEMDWKGWRSWDAQALEELKGLDRKVKTKLVNLQGLKRGLEEEFQSIKGSFT